MVFSIQYGCSPKERAFKVVLIDRYSLLLISAIRPMYLDAKSLKTLFDDSQHERKRRQRSKLKGRLRDLPTPKLHTPIVMHGGVRLMNNQIEQRSAPPVEDPILSPRQEVSTLLAEPSPLEVAEDIADKEMIASQMGMSLDEFNNMEAALNDTEVSQEEIVKKYRRLFKVGFHSAL